MTTMMTDDSATEDVEVSPDSTDGTLSLVVKKPARPKRTTKATKKVSKKAPAKATPRKSTAKTVIPQKNARKAPSKKLVKSASGPVSPRARGGTGATEFNEFGHRVGSDYDVIVKAMLEGGESRKEVTANAADRVHSMVTSTGKPKNLVAAVIAVEKLLERNGYTREASWRMVPPAS